MMPKFLHCLILAVLLYYPHNSGHADYRLVSGYLPPWSMNGNEEYPGSFIEIMREAVKRMGHKTQIEIYPWGRAQDITRSQKNVILFPLTRIPSREKKFSWVVRVKDVQIVYVSDKYKELNEDKARTLKKILVQKDTPTEILLKEKGFKNLIAVHDVSLKIPIMINYGRVDAWYTPEDMAEWVWKLNPKQAFPHVSKPSYVDDLYIAGSPDLDPKIKTAFQKVITDMKNDGTIAKIIARYRR